MPKLVVLHNPFRTSERDVLHVEPCRALAAVLEEHYGGAVRIDEFHVSRNGIVIEPEEARTLVFGVNDFVALVPRVGKGKKSNVLGILAGIALLTMTMGGGGGFLAGLFGGGSSGMMGMLLLGGLLMMGLGKVPKVDVPNMEGSSFEADPDWDSGSPVMIQGKPMPITYGTVRVRTPQVLSQHITSESRWQTLNLLLCGGEGPVDSVSDFQDQRPAGVKLLRKSENSGAVAFFGGGPACDFRIHEHARCGRSRQRDHHWVRDADRSLLQAGSRVAN